MDDILRGNFILFDPPNQLLYFSFEFLLLTYCEHFVVISVLLVLKDAVELREKQSLVVPVEHVVIVGAAFYDALGARLTPCCGLLYPELVSYLFEPFFFFQLGERFFLMTFHVTLWSVDLNLSLHLLHLYLVHNTSFVKAERILLKYFLDTAHVLSHSTTLIVIDEVECFQEVACHGVLVDIR